MPSLTPPAKQQFFTNAGAIAAGYKLWTYAAGTTTPQVTYQDRGGTIANTNPIILDARGEAIIYADDGLAYDFQLQDALGNTVWTRQGVVTSLWQIRTDLASTASGKGGALVGYKLTDAQAVASTVQNKLDGWANLVADFGGVGDNVADNAAAFLKAEASGYQRIYLPAGKFYASLAAYQLTKFYHGPGTIRLTGPGYAPGRFTQMIASPTKGTGTDANYYFSGDLSRVEAEYFILGAGNANIRKSLTESYFESTTTPHFEFFTNYSGGSGGDSRIPAGASSGATSVVVNSAAGLAVNDVVAIWNGATGAQVLTATVTAISGTTVTFTPALPSALPVNSQLGKAARTMQQFRFTQLNHNAAGDGYCQTYRVGSAYPPLAGQDHYFYTSTAGAIGGDINHGTNGCYSTTLEFNTYDNGNDVAHIAYVESFHRTNATAAWSGVWLGTFFKSEGTAYCDAAHVVSGKWKRGLDTVLMTPDADKAAISMAVDQRIYFNSTATGDPKLGLSQFGNLAGTAWIEYATSVGGINFVVAGNSQVQMLNSVTKVVTGLQTLGNLGFYGANLSSKLTVSGSRGGNAALASLLTQLATYGLITDSSTV